MSSKAERAISAEQAARLIYRTEAPSPVQVGAVCTLMQRGELKQSARQHFTTTRSAVIEYLAAEELRRCESRTSADGQRTRSVQTPASSAKQASGVKLPKQPRRTGDASNRQLRLVYRELLSDYFRSVVFCGRRRDRSPQYRRAVLGMQIFVLLVLLAVGGWTIRTMLAGEPFVEEPWTQAGRLRLEEHNPGEKRVIEAWLRANRKGGELLDILPGHARPGGKAIRARFRWTWADGKTKIDDQIFVLRGAEILRLEEPDAGDDAIEQRE
jgi:hypothetical protein